jgi:hypothetical protein
VASDETVAGPIGGSGTDGSEREAARVATLTAKPTTTEWIALNLLFSDPEYQRGLDMHKVDKIVRTLDLDALGLLCVSQRPNGLYAVIDGAHRAEVLRTYGFAEDDVVHCEVYKGLSQADEALMFRLRNNRIPVSKLALFHARLVEGDEVAISINQLLESYGWKVMAGGKGPYLACVDTTENIYWQSPIALNRTLSVITRAWGAHQITANRSIVAAFGKIFIRYGDEIDVTDLTRRMAGYEGGAQGLLGRSRGLRALRGGSVPDAVCENVMDEYNRRRTTTKLPNWR